MIGRCGHIREEGRDNKRRRGRGSEEVCSVLSIGVVFVIMAA